MGPRAAGGCVAAGGCGRASHTLLIVGGKLQVIVLVVGGSAAEMPAGRIMQCPGTKLWMYGLSPTYGRSTWKAVRIGGRDARYWQFQVPCGPKMPTGTGDKATFSFTQREWYLLQAKIPSSPTAPYPAGTPS